MKIRVGVRVLIEFAERVLCEWTEGHNGCCEVIGIIDHFEVHTLRLTQPATNWTTNEYRASVVTVTGMVGYYVVLKSH